MAKNKQQRSKDIGFVPSTGDESYLTGVPDAPTNDEADAINHLYLSGVKQAQVATETMIECGKLLLVARNKFKGDNEFGKWRKSNINFSQSHCQRLMSVAREFGDCIDNAALLPISTLSELVSAPDETKRKALDDAADGNPPTRASVIEEKKEKQGKKPEIPSTALPKVKEAAMTPEERAQVVLDMHWTDRIAKAAKWDNKDALVRAWLILGVPPYHDGLMAENTLSILVSGLIDGLETEDVDNYADLQLLVEEAAEIIEDTLYA